MCTEHHEKTDKMPKVRRTLRDEFDYTQQFELMNIHFGSTRNDPATRIDENGVVSRTAVRTRHAVMDRFFCPESPPHEGMVSRRFKG